jgi:hypothetical protein
MRRNLKTLGDLGVSNNARAPHADLTSAPELFGDPFEDGDLYGDAEDGDIDDAYGDVDYGDIINDDSLSAFKLISGDVEEGDINWSKFKKPAIGVAAAAGGYLAAKKLRDMIRKRRARQQAASNSMSKMRNRQTLVQQRNLRRNAGKIDRTKKMPFFQVIGAKMNSSPIDPMESFIADMFKHNLDRQASDTPFLQETVIGTFLAGTWTCTSVGIATNRFYTGLILQIGINMLNAAPGTVFTVTSTLPTINGTLTVSSTPWIFTIENKFDVRFLFFPWQLVSNRPFPVLGQYSSTSAITVQVSGLPSASAVTLVIPGSLHPWTVAMRNALI